MALHGEINVNAQPIAQWAAVRQNQHPDLHYYDPESGGFIYAYSCEYVRYADGKKVCFEVRHNYELGAAVLAAKVIHEASILMALLEADDDQPIIPGLGS